MAEVIQPAICVECVYCVEAETARGDVDVVNFKCRYPGLRHPVTGELIKEGQYCVKINSLGFCPFFEAK